MAELEQDLNVDLTRLDAEWVKLPQLYFKYREEADYVESSIQRKKLDLEQKAATVDKDVRQNPELYLGEKKYTEAMVKAFVDSAPDVVAVKEELLNLGKKKRLLASAIAALEIKKDSLKNLTTLYASEYFVSSPGDGSGTLPDVSKKNIRREIKNRMKESNNED